MAVDTIDLDVEARRISEAEARAKAEKIRRLLEEQEAKIRALMAQQDLEYSEPDLEELGLRYLKPGFKKAGEFVKGMEYDKGKKPEDFEINITQNSKGNDFESPVPVKPPYANINAQMRAEAPKMIGGRPDIEANVARGMDSKKIDPNDLSNNSKAYDAYVTQRNNAMDTRSSVHRLNGNDYDTDTHPRQNGNDPMNYPYRNNLEAAPADKTTVERPKEVPENWWLKQLTPEVNSALEAIAKRDPEAMMLPEVRELLQRSRDGYNKQIGIAAVAPWTNNPEQTMNLANAFREQGDKNLMDAANNLETIRTRQLDATKAMADDLTRQKGNLAGLGSSVLNMQGQGLMSLPAVYEGAREAMTEANRVHETGDARLKSAQASLNSFLGSSIDAMLKTDKKNKAAGIQKLQEINDLVNSNGTSESAWYDTVDPETNEKKVGLISKLNELKPYLNQNSQADLTKRIDAMNEDLAAYKAAMATEKQHRATAFNAEMRGNQVFNTLANVGQSFKMPLTEISPISSEVGELEEAYGKSNQNDYKNNSYNSGNEQFELHGDNKIIKKNGGNNGGPTPVPKGTKAEASYKHGIDVLNRYRSARLAAANVQAALQEGNTTEAAVTRANAELEKRALDAKNLISGLATQAYGGNDTAYVVLGALRSSPFGPEVMELGKLYTGQITTGVGKFNQKNDILDKQNAEIQKYLRELNLGL